MRNVAVTRPFLSLLLLLALLTSQSRADTTINGPTVYGTGLTVVGNRVTNPVATGSTFGIVKPDGTTCTVTAGVITCSGTGLNQLTGDILAGPGTGSQAATLPNIVSAATNLKITYNAKGQVTAGATAASTDLSDTANISLLNATQTSTGAKTFSSVFGSIGNAGAVVSGTTYTFVAGDCGKTVVFTSGSAVVATIPAAIVPATTVCSFAVLQVGAGKVSVNGTAVSAATLISPSSFTATSGTAGSMIGLTLLTISAATDAFLTGDGS